MSSEYDELLQSHSSREWLSASYAPLVQHRSKNIKRSWWICAHIQQFETKSLASLRPLAFYIVDFISVNAILWRINILTLWNIRYTRHMFCFVCSQYICVGRSIIVYQWSFSSVLYCSLYRNILSSVILIMDKVKLFWLLELWILVNIVSLILVSFNNHSHHSHTWKGLESYAPSFERLLNPIQKISQCLM